MVQQQVRQLRRIVVVWLSLLTLAILIGGGVEDYRSCQRQEPVRSAQRNNIPVFKDLMEQDAQRAEDYASLDPNLKGRRVNMKYGAQRRKLVAQLKTPPMIDCSFPAGT